MRQNGSLLAKESVDFHNFWRHSLIWKPWKAVTNDVEWMRAVRLRDKSHYLIPLKYTEYAFSFSISIIRFVLFGSEVNSLMSLAVFIYLLYDLCANRTYSLGFVLGHKRGGPMTKGLSLRRAPFICDLIKQLLNHKNSYLWLCILFPSTGVQVQQPFRCFITERTLIQSILISL